MHCELDNKIRPSDFCISLGIVSLSLQANCFCSHLQKWLQTVTPTSSQYKTEFQITSAQSQM